MELAEQVHQIIWGPWTLAIFLATGIFYTIKSHFFQIRGLPVWWRETLGSLGKSDTHPRGDHQGISQFQSVCTALAATAGTGNIAGVATALTAGGPGALFWMWVSAGIGMVTAYSETFLGIRWRYRDAQGSFVCGPFVYMEKGLGLKGLAILYSLFALLSSLGMGSMVQANSVSETLNYSWSIPPWLTGGILTFLVLLVVFGGVKRIGTVTERLMPAAFGIYLLFSLLVLIFKIRQLPGAFKIIFCQAFTPEAAVGGAVGCTVSRGLRYGMSRGVFSNEAGLGTLAVLHGAAENTTPEQQGMWAMFEVFFDTIVMCTMTALVILCTAGPRPEQLACEGAALASWCFGKELGAAGGFLISGAMAVFAFATIIAWFYLGRQAAVYLCTALSMPEKSCRLAAARAYPLLYLGAVFAGCLGRVELIWILSDVWNGLMAFPNLTALLFLSGQVHFPKTKGAAE